LVVRGVLGGNGTKVPEIIGEKGRLQGAHSCAGLSRKALQKEKKGEAHLKKADLLKDKEAFPLTQRRKRRKAS